MTASNLGLAGCCSAFKRITLVARREAGVFVEMERKTRHELFTKENSSCTVFVRGAIKGTQGLGSPVADLIEARREERHAHHTRDDDKNGAWLLQGIGE